MRSLERMWGEFKSELSPDLEAIAEQPDFERWINDGRTRLGYYVGNTATLTWSADDWTVSLPSDYCQFDSIEPDDGVIVPAWRVWRNKLRFDEQPTDAGTVTLFYLAFPAEITGAADSTMPDVLDQALISYALYRFYKWLAGSRADYRRYSTIAQGNAADVPQLLAAAAGHRQDFLEALDTFLLEAPVSYFGDV